MAEDEKNKEPVVVRHEQLESVTAVSVSIFNPLHIEMGGEARDSIGQQLDESSAAESTGVPIACLGFKKTFVRAASADAEA